MTRPELVELGAPKMEGQCHIFTKKTFLNKVSFFAANYIRWIMWKSKRLHARLC
jgi:hypothetical protein